MIRPDTDEHTTQQNVLCVGEALLGGTLIDEMFEIL